MSENMDDIYTTGVSAPNDKRAGLTQKVSEKPTMGGVINRYDPRKFYSYDKMGAQHEKKVTWHVTKDDVMEASVAGATLARIHQALRINTESAARLEAFNDAMFFCHTINSGSVLQPGRSRIQIEVGNGSGGRDYKDFDFQIIVNLLGVDNRRFFRAFADDIRAVNKAVLDSYDPNDPEARERHGWLLEVASDRGLSRHPDLAHDSADKCLSLTPQERQALAQSKLGVFANIANVADSIHSNSRLISNPAATSVANRN